MKKHPLNTARIKADALQALAYATTAFAFLASGVTAHQLIGRDPSPLAICLVLVTAYGVASLVGDQVRNAFAQPLARLRVAAMFADLSDGRWTRSTADCTADFDQYHAAHPKQSWTAADYETCQNLHLTA